MPDATTRIAAAWTLEQLGWQPEDDVIASWYYIARQKWEQAVAMGVLAIEPLTLASNSDDLNVRNEAILALEKIKGNETV